MTVRKIAFVIVAILSIFSYKDTRAESLEEPNYSLNIGAISYHDTGSKQNKFNQDNKMFGLRIWDKSTLLGGKPYFEADYIQKNSVGGTTITLGGGLEWTLVESRVVNLCGGVQAFYMNYENPHKDKRWDGFVATPYLCLKKDSVSINLVRLGPKALFLYMSIDF